MTGPLALGHQCAMLIVEDGAAPADARGAAMAIGNFDGVHRGHQQVIGLALQLARARGVPAGVLSFEPHPVQLFRPEDAPFRLTLRQAKARQLAELGVDVHVVIPFTAAFSAQSPECFVQDVLVDRLAISHAIVGYDFHYGHKRQGNAETLEQAAGQFGFGFSVLDEVADEGGGPISSSAVREALRTGQPREAAHILGRPWEVESTVQLGDQRGRTLGYPTANMVLGDQLRPAYGIYAVEASIAATNGQGNKTEPDWGPWLPGVANFGIRPMYRSQEPLMETHLFDFDRDIYGQRMRVRLIDHLRLEKAFASVDELVAQMDRDAQKARAVLADHEWLAP
ncbi:MAG: bifunctional riboflavin kinase/FAD synthetase [Pseudomonadota bacterium]